MRGALLNPFEGMVLQPSFSPNAEVDMHGREFSYWMWRVAAIRVDVSASITTKKRKLEDEDVEGSYSLSATALSIILNEENQAISREPHLASFIKEEPVEGEEGTVIAASMTTSWAQQAQTPQGNFPNETIIPIQISLNILVPKHELTHLSCQFGSIVGVGNLPFSGNALLSGIDLILGTSYLHSIPLETNGVLYTGADPPEDGSEGVVSASAQLSIRPFRFYEWRNSDGVPLYDASNGSLL